MKGTGKKIISIIFFSTFFTRIFAKSISIDFYGVSCPDAETNMIQLTEEFFIAQLKELSYTVVDCRSSDISKRTFDDSEIFNKSSENANIFFATITKQNNQKDSWNCKLILFNNKSKNKVIQEKEYDSFYKILMEKKDFISQVLTKFYQQDSYKKDDSSSNPRKIPASTQNIAGNWSADDYIDKIVILKGGRGFIIFKNGASMNISVLIDENDRSNVKILQTSRSNASFFPEMDRKAALDLAPTAKPIEWSFCLTNNMTLEGTKKTISQSGSYIQIPAKWTKNEQ